DTHCKNKINITDNSNSELTKDQINDSINASENVKDLTLVELAKLAMKWKLILVNILSSVYYTANLSHLKTINDYGEFNNCEIQIFGEYGFIKNSYTNIPGIECFEPATYYSWKNGNSIKRIEIRGNDGRKYIYGFSEPVSNVYEREHRCIQFIEFLNSESALDYKIRQFSPLTNRYRLSRVIENHVFLDDILADFTASKYTSTMDLVLKFIEFLGVKDFYNIRLKTLSTNLNESKEKYSNPMLNEFTHKYSDGYSKNTNDDIISNSNLSKHINNQIHSSENLQILNDDSKNTFAMNKKDEYQQKSNISKSYIENPSLNDNHQEIKNNTNIYHNLKQTNHKIKLNAYKKMTQFIGDDMITKWINNHNGNRFYYKKSLLTAYIKSNIICYILSIGKRNPSRIAFGKNTGKYYTFDIFPDIKNGLFYNDEKVHFRITPAILNLFGLNNIQGTMLKLAYTLSDNIKNIDCIEEIFNACFYEKHGHLKKNLKGFFKKLHSLRNNFEKLVNESTDPDNLCEMDPLWNPWY
ncbi:hypothetical protein EDEG_00383, partial [Edhazardia aedis USNM 41457]